MTLEDMLGILKANFTDLDITIVTLFRVIRDNNITLKMKRHLHEPVKRFGKDIDIKSKIKEFYDEVKNYKIFCHTSAATKRDK